MMRQVQNLEPVVGRSYKINDFAYYFCGYRAQLALRQAYQQREGVILILSEPWKHPTGLANTFFLDSQSPAYFWIEGYLTLFWECEWRGGVKCALSTLNPKLTIVPHQQTAHFGLGEQALC